MSNRCENCGSTNLAHPDNALCDLCWSVWDDAPNPPFGWEEVCNDLARGAVAVDGERGAPAGASGGDDE